MIETIAIAGVTSAVVSALIVVGAVFWLKSKVQEMMDPANMMSGMMGGEEDP